MKPTRFIDSVNCAIEGILYAARTQKHMRQHFLAAVAILLAVLFLRVSAIEFTLLAVSICFVLFAELFNTAIETVVDMLSPEYSEKARIAKDVAAGGVLIAAVSAAVMGWLVLANHIFPLYRELLAMFGTPAETGTLVAILVVVIAVVIIKALTGKGTPLHGGLPSGHAAIAFAIATAVSLNTQDPLTSVLSFALAAMVSHSRLLLRIHSTREVIAGALLGMGITLLILLLFKLA
ncbi:MAG: diacylglycerol kinase [Geobacter sp.]|nr:diacylglycerol kinase [Geobacter sp.]